MAKSNEIIVGRETYKACKNYFIFQFLKSVAVKGKTDPIAIDKEIDSKASALRSNFDRQVSSEMVGRGNELDKLEIQALKVINGEGSVINIIGEAGIGKSRIIAELKKREVLPFSVSMYFSPSLCLMSRMFFPIWFRTLIFLSFCSYGEVDFGRRGATKSVAGVFFIFFLKRMFGGRV